MYIVRHGVHGVHVVHLMSRTIFVVPSQICPSGEAQFAVGALWAVTVGIVHTSFVRRMFLAPANLVAALRRTLGVTLSAPLRGLRLPFESILPDLVAKTHLRQETIVV